MALLPNPEITHHLDNFVVIETPTKNYGVGTRGMVRISREFYRHYEDAFDVLVLVLRNQDGVVNQWNVRGRVSTGQMAVERHTEAGHRHRHTRYR